MNYKIHPNEKSTTIFIEGNGIYSHYLVQDNEVRKFVDYDGDEVAEHFHTIGELPLNLEAKLLNELREQGKL